jgi:UDP-GlcNAc:undecaprenyl-phosphate GlcNAc-1-phosphate transferase
MFPFGFYTIAFLAGLLTTLCAMPLVTRWAIARKLVDEPGERKIHDQPIVLVGGLAVALGIFIPLIVAAILAPLLLNNFTGAAALKYGFNAKVLQLIALGIGAIGMVTLGWLDDKIELRPMPKFAGQTAVALLVAASGIRVTLFVESELFSYAVTVLWILTVTNAFNFIDNMNGVCTGLGFIAAWLCGWAAAVEGQYLVALLAFVTCGSLLGFLPFNFPSARAFLGDAGSHLVGFLCATLAILPNFFSEADPKRWAVLSPLLILLVPLLDLTWVVSYRTMRGKPFYVGDTNHLAHKLAAKGLPRLRVALILWLAAASAGLAVAMFY